MADNPIKKVGTNTNIPCPSKYNWKLSDVSEADAGRTEDALMHKMRIAQKVHIELEWQNLSSDSDVSTILTAFQPEYISVEFFDYKANGFLTKTFYVGDRSVTSYNRAKKISTISFNIIEQ
jgi:hypothetical protein